MATENKETLIKSLAVFEAENIALKEEVQKIKHFANENDALKKERTENLNREFELRKERDKLKGEVQDGAKTSEMKIAELQKQNDFFKNELNKLALLFDEYASAFADQTKMLAVFVKNTQTVERYLQTKIDTYNKGPEVKPEPKKEK